MSFNKDLQTGHRTERNFAQKLYEMGHKNVVFNTSTALKKLKEYDLSAEIDGVTLTFEVKGDTIGHKTGNAFIEFQGYRGVKSGISTTKADVYVYVVGTDTYCVPTDELKAIMTAGMGYYLIRDQKRDKNSTARGMLVPLSAINQYII